MSARGGGRREAVHGPLIVRSALRRSVDAREILSFVALKRRE